MINKICLNTSNSGRLFRCCFKDNLFYMNYLTSIYKGWFTEKKEKQSSNFEKVVGKMQNYIISKKNLLQVSVEDSKKKYESLVMKNNM